MCVCVYSSYLQTPDHFISSALLHYIIYSLSKLKSSLHHLPYLPIYLYIPFTIYSCPQTLLPTYFSFTSLSLHIYISIFPSDLAFSVTKKKKERKKEQSRFHNLLLLVRTSLITLNFIHSYSYLMHLISVVLMKFFYSFIEVSSYCNQFHI